MLRTIKRTHTTLLMVSVITIATVFGLTVVNTLCASVAYAGCTACTTTINSACGGIGNDCATKGYWGCKGSADTCTNASTSFNAQTSSTVKTNGTQKDDTQADCGNKATGGSCKWYGTPTNGICASDGEGTDSGTVDGCGMKDKYTACTP